MKWRTHWGLRHGPVMLTAQTTTGLFTAAAVSHWTPLDPHPGWASAAAAAGLGLVWWRGRVADVAPRPLAYQCGTWTAGSGWLLYTLTNGLSLGTVCTLAAGAVAAGAAVGPLRAREERRAETHLRQIRSRQLRTLAAEWEERIWKICRIRVQVVGIERQFDRDTDGFRREVGYTVEIELPDSGVGWETISKAAGKLTNAARLPWGCEVQVTRGVDRLRALLEVSTYNALGPVLPIPPAGPSTINDPIRLGKQREGSEGDAPLRWFNWVIVGSGGSGKTNLARTILNRVLECEDALAVVIDPNGGGIARPYLDPWLAGQVDRRPVLVVSDPADIEFVVEFFQAFISARMTSQYEAMAAVNDDKVPVSNRVPHIVVVVDETHSLPGRIQRGLVDVSNRGRGASIRVVYTALRGTGDNHLPPAILAQGKVRFLLGVNDAGEADKVFRDGPRPAFTALEPGYGNVRVTGGAPFLIKFYRTTPEDARECAIRTATWRPAGLEPESLALMPKKLSQGWGNLWNRQEHTPAGTGTSRTGRTGTGGTGQDRRPSVQEALDNLRNVRDRMRRTGSQPAPGTGTGRTNGTGTGGTGRPEDRFEDVVDFALPPELIVRLLAAFAETGDEEMPTADLAEFIGAAKSDLGRLLPQLGVYALRNPFPYRGHPGRVRGYARADVQAAADAIRRRELQVPPEITAWRSSKPLPDDPKDTP